MRYVIEAVGDGVIKTVELEERNTDIDKHALVESALELSSAIFLGEDKITVTIPKHRKERFLREAAVLEHDNSAWKFFIYGLRTRIWVTDRPILTPVDISYVAYPVFDILSKLEGRPRRLFFDYFVEVSMPCITDGNPVTFWDYLYLLGEGKSVEVPEEGVEKAITYLKYKFTAVALDELEVEAVKFYVPLIMGQLVRYSQEKALNYLKSTVIVGGLEGEDKFAMELAEMVKEVEELMKFLEGGEDELEEGQV